MATKTSDRQAPKKNPGAKLKCTPIIGHFKFILGILTVSCLWVVPSVKAQSQETPDDNAASSVVASDTKNYFMQQDEESNTIIFQTLEWTAGKHIKWYEVLLEKEDGAGDWIPVDNAIPEETAGLLSQDVPEYLGEGLYRTKTNRIVVSLHAKESGEPQLYRYTVSSYNLLEYKAASTDYISFEVKKAHIPKVEGISPDLIYLDTLYDPTIRVSGDALRKETDYYLVSDREIIRPVEVIRNDNNRRAEVVFDPNDFDVGEWLFRAENPGEFISDQPLTIKFMKWYDVSLSAGYSPLFVLYEPSVKDYLGTNFMPLGADIRGTFIFLKRRMGYLGVSLNGKWNLISGERDNYALDSTFVQALATVVYRYPIIRNRLSVEARLGGGMTVIPTFKFGFSHAIESEGFASIYPAATAGLSLSGYIWRGLFLEAGADLISTFTPGMIILSVAPVISVGWTL